MARNVLVDAGFVVALLSSRDAHHKWAVTQASEMPPPWTTCEAVLSEAFHLLGERGAPNFGALLHRRALLVTFALARRRASHETDREVFQRSDGIRRCLPGSHDRNACRSLHSHDRPRFSSLPPAQPPGSSLCDSRMICKLVWQGAGSSRSSRAPASSGLSRVHALPNRWPFPPLSNPQFIGRLKIEPKLGCRAQVTC